MLNVDHYPRVVAPEFPVFLSLGNQRGEKRVLTPFLALTFPRINRLPGEDRNEKVG